jgi:signal transduction histidine kinase
MRTTGSRRPVWGGLLIGIGAGTLAAFLLPGSPLLRALAAGSAAIAGALAGALSAARRRHLEATRRLVEIREELRFCQDHIMAAETYRSLGPYLEIVAHQIKSPLLGLDQAVRALGTDGPVPEATRATAAAIARNAEALQGTLRHLAGYALTRPGRSPFNVNTLLHEATLLCRHRARERKIVIEERYGTIPPVMGSAARIHQALLNVLINAVEAMPFEGGTITVTTAHEGDTVVTRVRDTGIGIRPDQLPRVFEPFFTTKPEQKGVGLGLWAAKSLLDIIGADITLRSAPHEGTEVTIVFPQAAGLHPGREGVEHPPELPRNTADDRDRQIV